MKVDKTFNRKSTIGSVQEIGLPHGWFAISHLLVPKMTERRRLHGKWCKLTTNKGTIYRVLRFSPHLKSTSEDAADIVLDWVGWINLNGQDEKINTPLQITIEESRWFEIPKQALGHPEPSYRLASLIALISLCLGLLSIALGVLSVWLAIR